MSACSSGSLAKGLLPEQVGTPRPVGTSGLACVLRSPLEKSAPPAEAPDQPWPTAAGLPPAPAPDGSSGPSGPPLLPPLLFLLLQ